jgi:hypothetical protein
LKELRRHLAKLGESIVELFKVSKNRQQPEQRFLLRDFVKLWLKNIRASGLLAL